MTPQATRQMNAIATMLSIAEDAGIPKVEFQVELEHDEDVKQIAENEKVRVYDPGFCGLSYWCVLHKGQHRIHIKGKDKQIKIIEP